MIDAHQHLIYPELFRYPWLDNVPTLSGKAFALEDYRRATHGSGIQGTVFMEVDVEQSPDEARFFCRLSEDPDNRILGVVAACRPESGHFADDLDSLSHPVVKGVRRILHNQHDDLSQSPGFRQNVASLGKRNLTFDMCFLARQLPLAIALADACPGTRLMLDHCGVPDIAGGLFEIWAAHIRELARRPHVVCKLSGLVTCSTRQSATPETLRAWAGHVWECFGPDRLVWGSDWPVCNLTSSLPDWIRITRELSEGWSESERAKVFSSNAISFYDLSPPRL